MCEELSLKTEVDLRLIPASALLGHYGVVLTATPAVGTGLR
jgi:hypothetical protein